MEKHRLSKDAAMDSAENKHLKRDKEKNRAMKTLFDKLKVRSAIECNSCGTTRCIFLMKAVTCNQKMEELER
eukprot:1320824-Ditylum_brightwellii.AAC.1